ncbi:MAG: DUF3592 domain-containing protein [Pseudomonadales bacterium]
MNESKSGRRTWRFWLLAGIGALASLLLVFVVTLALTQGDWRETEGRVASTAIVSSRSGGGPPAWDLEARFSYAVAGTPHLTPALRVFSDQDYSVVEAERERWPVGRTHTIYYDANAPDSASGSADGGAEAIAVVVTLMFPMVATALAFAWILLRRRRRTH